jgi:anti-anti-sigma factor
MIADVPPVTVLQLPTHLNPQAKTQFMKELMMHLKIRRPRIVIDCSRIRRMDKGVIDLLLASLEEAMKCNGDVKLSELRPVAEAVVRYAGLHRIFEIFPTVSAAEQSYQRLSRSIDNHAEYAMGQAELLPA